MYYWKCSIISNTSCLPKSSDKNRTDPDQTASEEAVWSGSSLFAILTSILWIAALITSIWEQNGKSAQNHTMSTKSKGVDLQDSLQVNNHMSLHISLSCESFSTNFTTERFLSSMYSLVFSQCWRGRQWLLTKAAGIDFLTITFSQC